MDAQEVHAYRPTPSKYMDKKRTYSFQVKISYSIVLSVTGFVLHFVWELAQCPLFFIHVGSEPTISAMILATLGDVAMTWIAQGIVALVSLNWFWAREKWYLRQWLSLFGLALVMSILVELYALGVGRWTYTEINPRIPGTAVSIIPALQLLVLFPLTFQTSQWISRKINLD